MANDITYLAWRDTDRKRKPVKKVEDAITRFQQRRGCRPTIIRVHPSFGIAAYDGVEVVQDAIVPRSEVYVG